VKNPQKTGSFSGIGENGQWSRLDPKKPQNPRGSRGGTGSTNVSDNVSDGEAAGSDPDLAWLVEVWAKLWAKTRREIIALVAAALSSSDDPAETGAGR
jgi:hypothetical protein